MKKHFIQLLFLFLPITLLSQELNVIPKPVKAEAKGGVFTLSENTKIAYSDRELVSIADFLNDFLTEHYNLQLSGKRTARNGNNMIRFILDRSAEEESYTLDIDENSVVIRGDRAGLFYGLQTLLQLMPTGRDQMVTLPQAAIEDKPRFKYRGAMLDVGRYFFTPNEVKRFLDLMAHYKLNILHWHLTEDAGWRIEIDKYPLLTEIGAWRRGTQLARPAESFDRLPHGGYYTKEQIREIVSYAGERIQLSPK